jgi:hypothetical protein
LNIHMSFKHLAQEMGAIKAAGRTTAWLLKLQPYKTTVVQSLKPWDPVARHHFRDWYFKLGHNGERDPM